MPIHALEEDGQQRTYTLRPKSRAGASVKLRLEVVCSQAFFLDAGRNLKQIQGEVELPYPRSRFLVVERVDGWFKLELPWGSHLRSRWLGDRVRVETFLRRTAGCGLVTWGSDKLSPAPESWELDLSCDRLGSREDVVWIEPYPRGASAAICLTDHPDFDTVERLAPIVDLLGRHGIQLTKGVFPMSDPVPGKREPGLDVPAYAALVEQLHAQGSEIAFHGIGPRRSSPPEAEFRRRADALAAFAPTTWIDHGMGNYLYTRRGTLPDGAALREVLGQLGIRNYWSYCDLWDNPVDDVSCLRSPSRPYALDVVTAARLLGREVLQPKRVAYFGAHAARNLLGANAVATLSSKTLRPHLLTAWREAASHRALRAAPLIIYGEDGSPCGLNLERTWVFDTALLNHPAIQLRPSSVDALERASGLLVAHCYLSCRHPYLSGSCFAPDESAPRLHPRFVEAIEHLGARQAEGRVVTSSFADLRSSLKAFVKARLRRRAGGWQVSGEGGGEVVIAGSPGRIARWSGHGRTWVRDGTGYLSVRLPREGRVDLDAEAIK